MALLAAAAAWLALGLPTALVLARAGRRDLAVASLPFAGGLALLLPLIAAPWLGGSLARWGAKSLLAGAALGAASWAALPRARAASGGSTLGARWLPAALVPGVAGAGLLAAGHLLAQGWPGYGWDGLAIWLLRAKVLALSPALPAALFGEPLLAEGHWDYPLELPALLAWLARHADLGLQQYALALAAVLAPIPLAVTLGLGRALAPPRAAALAIAPLAVPGVLPIHFEGYADPLLVCVAVPAVVAALAATLHRDPALALLAGGMLAVAVSLKNEGALWWTAAVGGCASVAALAPGPRRAALPDLLRVAVPGLVLFGLWQATCLRLGASSDLAGAQRWDLLTERLAFVTAVTARLLLSPQGAPWLLLCGAALVASVGGAPGQRLARSAALLSPLAVYLAGLELVYLTTPHDVGWHVATSLPRTLLGVPPALLGVALLAPTLRRRAAGLTADPAAPAGSGARDRR